MRIIRQIVYRLGFRPKYPSLLFSPTLHFKYEVFPAMAESIRKVFDEGSGNRQ